MEKKNELFLLKTINEINIILGYSEGITIEDLAEKPVVLDGIVFRMIQMSEHMNRISQEFKEANSNIDWTNIKGFRNKLVHDYGDVDLHFVYNAIKDDIPKLKKALLEIIPECEHKAIMAVDKMRTISEANGNSEMTLDEINEEIRLARSARKKK